MDDLLKAPSNRPASFYTGTTEYDVDGAGYMSGGDFLLNTTIRGNGKVDTYVEQRCLAQTKRLYLNT